MLRFADSAYSSSYTLPAPAEQPRPIMTRAGLDFSPLLQTIKEAGDSARSATDRWSPKLPSMNELLNFLRAHRTAVYATAAVLLVLAMRRRR